MLRTTVVSSSTCIASILVCGVTAIIYDTLRVHEIGFPVSNGLIMLSMLVGHDVVIHLIIRVFRCKAELH